MKKIDVLDYHTCVSRSVLLRMKNLSDKVSEKIKTHFMFNTFSFENRAVYEIMWKNILQSQGHR